MIDVHVVGVTVAVAVVRKDGVFHQHTARPVAQRGNEQSVVVVHEGAGVEGQSGALVSDSGIVVTVVAGVMGVLEGDALHGGVVADDLEDALLVADDVAVIVEDDRATDGLDRQVVGVPLDVEVGVGAGLDLDRVPSLGGRRRLAGCKLPRPEESS